MKTWKLTFAALIAATAFAGTASAYTIADNYIGGTPTHNYSNRDVVGDYKYYDIDGMNVATTGKNMKVDVITSFVSQTQSSTIWNEQTNIGDLFIGTAGWKPSGSIDNLFSTDTASTSGTLWDYVVVLTPHIPISNGDATKTGTATVYSTSDGNYIKSNIGTLNTNAWIYRDDQYVQFSPYSTDKAVATGSWTITDNANDKNGITYGDLAINFDYSSISAKSNDWAFHWAMTCGNDVIEGETTVPPVPEPSTFVLLGAGLLGAGLVRRRIKK